MTLPTVTVEIAFVTAPNDPAPVWVDVTQWVRARPAISITRGRPDELGDVQASKCSLTLDNSDGRFTPGNASSPYFPNVKKGRRIRVSVTWNAVTYRRFTGYVDSWPVAWADAKLNVADVAITASSRLARISRIELRSIVEEEYLLDHPRVYYTLGDPQGTTQAGNAAEGVQPFCSAVAVGSGGSITFGNATGPATDGMTAAQFTPVNSTNYSILRSTSPDPMVTALDTTLTLECFFLTSGTSQDLVNLGHASASSHFTMLYVNSTGKLTAESGDFSGNPQYYLLASSASVNNGQTHHALIRETITGGTTLTATLYLDGVQVATAGSISLSEFRVKNQLTLGSGVTVTNGPLSGVLAHVAVAAGTVEMSAARALAHANSGLTGFSGERSDQRIARLAAYAGVPAAEIVTETGLSTSIVNQVTNGRTALDLMNEVAATESGVLFDARDGTLTFHARSHRYGAASSLMLSAAAGEITGIEPTLDDQGLVNDITASREGGITVRFVDTASVTDNDRYRQTIQLLTTIDNEVLDAATWKVGHGATPLVRVPVADVDLTTAGSTQTTALLAREIGDRVTLTVLPAQAPAPTMDFFIEGSTEQIMPDLYQMSLNLSPADLSGVWLLDDSVYSVLGTTTRLAY